MYLALTPFFPVGLSHIVEYSGLDGMQIIPRFSTNVYYNCVTGQVCYTVDCGFKANTRCIGDEGGRGCVHASYVKWIFTSIK